MIDVHKQVKPMGPVYHGASTVMSAIDALATLLTGNRHYFWSDGSGATEGQRSQSADKDARERGDVP